MRKRWDWMRANGHCFLCLSHGHVADSWPAISDIWLGVRTVPVLSVAKEVAAPARSPTGRGAPEHRQVDAD